MSEMKTAIMFYGSLLRCIFYAFFEFFEFFGLFLYFFILFLFNRVKLGNHTISIRIIRLRLEIIYNNVHL